MRIPPPFVRRRARIEIIPLIDIIFFLLATFVVVSLSMVKNRGIAVQLPKASTATIQKEKDFVVITLAADGRLYWNKENVSFEQLSDRLRLLTETTDDPKVLINGDKKAFLGEAIRVLDQARKLGINKVSIQTKAEPST